MTEQAPPIDFWGIVDANDLWSLTGQTGVAEASRDPELIRAVMGDFVQLVSNRDADTSQVYEAGLREIADRYDLTEAELVTAINMCENRIQL